MRLSVRFTVAAGVALLALSTAASTTQVAFAHPVPDPSHPARHGIVWQRGAAQPAASISPMSFGGGVSGIGVTTGAPKVYVIFWGSQWGAQSTNSAGNLTFSGDSSGMAPDYQAFMKGLGTGSETWSGVMTQYCEGVATGSTSCPTGNTSHVGYPTGGAFAGVWYDNSTSAPSQATENQLAQEAFNAAGHFGNSTATANRNAQYVVVSPHGTHPDGYNTLFSNWCAWHDYTSDPALGGGPANGSFGVAFTNLPYIPDTGSSCGANFNNLGALAGVTIVGGHEYAETITDQFPAGGWTDSSGAENGDKCAWISTGSQGASQNITLTTGTFAVQSTYANDGNSGSGACEVSHPIVTNGGTTTNDFSISASPSSQTVTAGGSTTYTVSTAVTSGSAESVSLSASGLPSGATASFSPASVTAGGSSTLTVSTTSGAATGTSNFTITGTAPSATHSTTAGLTINAPAGGNPIVNGGFEAGSLTGWTESGPAAAVSGSAAHSGTYSALLGSTGSSNGTSSIAQTFTIPAGATTLSFWYEETCLTNRDYASATLRDNTTATTTTIFKSSRSTSGWVEVTYSVSGLAGHSVTLTLNDRARSDATHTYFDDVAVA
jgi:hypothetical protein